MDTVKNIERFGKRAKGRSELIRHLKGERLTRNEAILAHCYDCTGGYADSIESCGVETCSLYRDYHPYRKR